MKKKILVTGAFGFIGSHLVEYLVKNSYEVIAFDRYNTSSSYGWLEKSKYKKDIEFILGDIRDYDSVSKIMKKTKICLHLAALIGIPYSYYSPLAYIKTNIEGTYNILESAKNANVQQTIITSTSEVYGTAQYEPIDEKHPFIGQSPYSASKIAADQIAKSYYRSFNLPIKIIRPFNVFGPRQSLRAVIPTIINQLLYSNSLNLGNINVQRDFTYVLDLCRAYEELFNSNIFFGKEVNIGTNKNYKIEEVIDIIIKKLNKTNVKINKEVKRIRPHKSEVYNLICDNSLFKNNTKWKDKISFETGLGRTIDWFKKNKSLYQNHKNYNV